MEILAYFKTHRRIAVCMRLPCLFFVAALAASGAQAPISNTPDAQATLGYIHAAWADLTRSLSDCRSLGDEKVNGARVLYLPAEIAMPPSLAAVEQTCQVKIARLPRRIEKLGTCGRRRSPRRACSICPIRTSSPVDASTRCTAGTATSFSWDWKPITTKHWPRGSWTTSCLKSNITGQCSTPTARTI